MSGSHVDVKIALPDAEPFDVVSCRIREGLSQRTHAVATIAKHGDLELEPLLCRSVPVTIAVADEPPRRLPLVFGAGRLVGNDGGRLRYELELFDPLWLLGLRTHTRKHRGETAQQIVEKVLSEAEIACRFELETELPVRKYCAQYRERDLDFVSRLLETEGLFYRVDEDGTVVISDHSPSAPAIAAAPFSLIEAAEALGHGETGIHEIAKVARLESGTVTLGDHNWKRPDLSLQASVSADRDRLLEVFEYPAGYRQPEQGTRLAQRRLEAMRARAEEIEGRSNTARLAPGLAFEVDESAGELHAGEQLVVEIEHRYVNRAIDEAEQERDDAGRTYDNRFAAIPLDVPYRPPLSTPRPTVGGLHTAMVRGPVGEEIHTDRYGRFRIQMHWDREAVGTDDDSRWLRLAQECSTSMQLARVGWEMFVGYIDGDPDRPIGLGRAINGVATPSYTQPAEKNRMTVKTPSSPATGGFSELTMNDTAGTQGIGMRAERNLDILVKNDKTEDVGNDETHSVGTDFAREVKGDQSITIGGNLSVDVGNNMQVDVVGSRSETIAATETVGVDGGDAATAGGDESETVGTLRMTTAGDLQMPDFESMAKQAGKNFLQNISPQAAAAKGIVEKYYNQYKDGSESLERDAETAARNAASTFAGQIIDGKSVKEAGSSAGKSASSVLPSQQELNKCVPSKEWVPSGNDVTKAGKQALSDATGGLIAENVNHHKIIGLFCAGGIERAAETTSLKIVGGSYVTAAVGGIDLAVGYGYAETVGALKLTVAKQIEEAVEGTLTVAVGGNLHRVATNAMTLKSETDTTVTAGTRATYESEGGGLTVKDATHISIEAGQALTLLGGSAQIRIAPDGITMEGDLATKADTRILFAGNPLNVTKA